MAIGRLLVSALAFVVLMSCDSKDPPSPEPGDPSGDVQVSGQERLGWLQRATDANELGLFQYVVYVDGVRTTLTSVSCSTTSTAAGFECSAALPALTAGPHTLEVASMIVDPLGTLESARSAPLRVVMTGTGGTSSSFTSLDIRTRDGAILVLEQVAEGLRDPVDLAFAPDGATFVAERAGTVRVIRGDVLAREPSLDVSSDLAGSDGALLGIALDPDFEETAFMYALYAAAGPRDTTDLVLARFRGVANRFGERAVLMARAARPIDQAAGARSAAGALRIGADGKLYLGVEGEILRLNNDATTPGDHVPFTPVYSSDHPRPRALDWHPNSHVLWVVEGVDPSGGRLTTATPDFAEPRRAVPRIAYQLPQGTGPGSATFYRNSAIPNFRGDLFIAAIEGRHLMRLRFDATNATRIASVERLLTDQIGPIRVVAEGRDGALYVASDTALYRLRP